MKNKNIYSLSVLLLILSMGFAELRAQSSCFTLKGVVCEEKGDGVPYATVRAVSVADSTLRYVAVAKDDGTFSVDSVAEGRYLLSVTCVGYEDFARNMSVSGSTGACTIVLKEDKNMLDGVTVMAGFTKMKPSGDVVVQVQGNPLAKGRSTIDFMRYLRDLEVTNNSISVRGKTNTRIYLNDRLIDLAQLKTIQPSMIARIEILPNSDPSNGGDLMGGVIKVYLREDVGLLGSVSLYSAIDGYGPLSICSPSVNLLFSKGKLTVSNFFRLTPYSHYRSSKREVSERAGERIETVDYSVNHGKSFSDNLALRYSFNKTDYIDVYGGVGASYPDWRDGSVSGDSEFHMLKGGNTYDYTAGVQFKKGLSANGRNYLKLETEYSKQRRKSDQDYSYNGTMDKARLDVSSDALSLNYYALFGLTDKLFMSGGVMYDYLMDRQKYDGNDVLSYVADMRFSNKESRWCPWLNAYMYVGKMFFRASLTYKFLKQVYTDYLASANNVSYNENTLSPYFVFNWILDEKKNRALSVNYNRYYSLPNYNLRSSVMVWQNGNLYGVGNPNLKQTSFDLIQVYYSFNNSWAAYYTFSYGNNIVATLMRPDEARPGVYFTRPENAGTSMQNSLTFSYSGTLFKMLTVRSTLSAVNQREKMPEKEVNSSYVYFSNDFDLRLNKSFGLMLSLRTGSKLRTLSAEYSAHFNMEAAAYASLLKDRLSLNLRCESMVYYKDKSKMYGDDWIMTRQWIGRMTRLILTASWNFNLGKKVKRVNLPTGGNSLRREDPVIK